MHLTAAQNGLRIGVSTSKAKGFKLKKMIIIGLSLFIAFQIWICFEDFSVLFHQDMKHIMEFEESLLIIRNKPSTNPLFSVLLNELRLFCSVLTLKFRDQFLTVSNCSFLNL